MTGTRLIFFSAISAAICSIGVACATAK